MEHKEPETTIGDRIKNAAFGGALGAGVIGLAALLENGISKLTSKRRAVSTSLALNTAGVTAIIGAAYGFFTANKAEETKREAYLETTIADANNPANNYTKKQREEIIAKALDDAMKGKMPDNTESTKFRDKVTASRSAGTSPEIGA